MTEIEYAFVGGLLRLPDTLDGVLIPTEALTDPSCNAAYSAMVRLFNAGRPITPEGVAAEIRKDGIETATSIVANCLELRAFTKESITDHAESIGKAYRVRQLSDIGRRLQESTQRPDCDPDSLVNDLESELSDLGRTRDFSDFEWMSDTIAKLAKELTSPDVSGGKVIETRIKGLNDIIVGFEPGDYAVIAGPPSFGKTAFAADVCYFNASQNGLRSLYFNLDQRSKAMARRVLMAKSGLNKSTIAAKDGPYVEVRNKRVAEIAAEEKLAKGGILTTDRAGISIDEIERISRRAVRQFGVGLIAVDYVGQVRWDGKSEGRTQDVSNISGRLKALALDLNVPILVLCQLSRAYDAMSPNDEKNKWPRPRLTMLRDSGAIEQDANVVLFLYSKLKIVESRYGTESDMYKRALNTFKHGSCIDSEVIVAKNKDGETGTVQCQFNPNLMHFSTADTRHPE